MEREVLAAVITVVGSIVTAAITGATTLVIELIKNGKIDSGSSWRWLRRFGFPLAFVAVVLGGALVGYLLYDGTASRLERALPDVPDYRKRIYATIGLGFVYSKAWQIEDYAFRFGAGIIELVSDRDTEGKIVTQGIRIGIENIDEHHWGDPESEFNHFESFLQKRCVPNGWSRTTAAIAGGLQADLFKCQRKVGDFTISEQTYWRQLSRCLRLKIFATSELSGQPRQRFDQQLSQFILYLRFDDTKIQALNNGRRTGCVDETLQSS